MGKIVTTYLIDGNPKGTQYAIDLFNVCLFIVLTFLFLTNKKSYRNQHFTYYS